MELSVYEAGINEIDKEAGIKKDELTKKFCLENNPYKVGDTITDHARTIRIQKILWGYGSLGNKPCCRYKGVELKKDGTPVKKGTISTIWQSNIIKP